MSDPTLHALLDPDVTGKDEEEAEQCVEYPYINHSQQFADYRAQAARDTMEADIAFLLKVVADRGKHVTVGRVISLLIQRLADHDSAKDAEGATETKEEKDDAN